MKFTTTLFTLCLLNCLKEALFFIMAPFFPSQMNDKQVPKYIYAPLFTYDSYTCLIRNPPNLLYSIAYVLETIVLNI